MELRSLRNECGFTQKQAAQFLGISYKTYFRYENDEKYINTLKYDRMCELLANEAKLDEDHGVLTIENIKEVVTKVFSKYDIKVCYLFGSYAKGLQKETSDVDLMIDSTITGLNYYGLLQDLIDELHKRVDLIIMDEAVKNPEFIKEILKDGIRIYG